MELSEHQAYNAIVDFLDAYYWRTKSDEIGFILGSMMMLEDGSTADSAMWIEWMEAIGVENRKISELEAYNGIIRFLETFYQHWKLRIPDDIECLLNGMKLLPDGTTADPTMWEEWLKAIEKGKDEIKYLTFV